jgi:uncharacterized membrane protein
MIKKISSVEKMLMVSVGFTMALLAFRVFKADSMAYVFFGWNLLLAIIPFLFSRKLATQNKFGITAFLLIGGWLLFFPNAPYIVTDIFHYHERPPVPKWFDLLLVTSAAWNGLLLGIASLMQVENFLAKHIKAAWVRLAVFSSMVLCGYGIYIGRFLRFNSWNIVTQPSKLVYASAHHVLQPQENLKVWGFTFLFAAMFAIIYFTLKAMKGNIVSNNMKTAC